MFTFYATLSRQTWLFINQILLPFICGTILSHIFQHFLSQFNIANDTFKDTFSFDVTHTLNQNCTSLCFYPDEKCLSAEKFVRSNLSSILLQFKAHVKHRDDKIQTNFNNLFTCPTKQNAVRNAFMSVSAKSVDNLTQYLLTVSKELDVKLTNYSKNGSNWAISKILSINFKTHKYCQIANISGRSFIETSRFINMKKCCVNVKNEDSKGFLYSVFDILTL